MDIKGALMTNGNADRFFDNLDIASFRNSLGDLSRVIRDRVTDYYVDEGKKWAAEQVKEEEETRSLEELEEDVYESASFKADELAASGTLAFAIQITLMFLAVKGIITEADFKEFNEMGSTYVEEVTAFLQQMEQKGNEGV